MQRDPPKEFPRSYSARGGAATVALGRRKIHGVTEPLSNP